MRVAELIAELPVVTAASSLPEIEGITHDSRRVEPGDLFVAVTGERLKDCGLFNPDMLDEFVRDHQSGRRDYSSPLWTLLMFDRFLESRA